MGLEETLFRDLSNARSAYDITRHAPQTISSVGKFRTEEDEGVVSKLFGVPVGFQFGTAAGMTGLPAIVTDIVTDPTTYLAGIGLLTKAGRAGAAVGKVGRFGKAVAGIKHMTVAAKADMFESAARIADHLDIKRFIKAQEMLKGKSRDEALHMLHIQREGKGELEKLASLADVGALGAARKSASEAGLDVLTRNELGFVRQAIMKGDTQDGIQVLANLSRDRVAYAGQLHAAAMAANNGDPRAFAKIAKDLEKSAPTLRYQRMFGKDARRNLEEFIRRGEASELNPTLRKQAEAGERSLLSFGIPFTRFTKSISVPGEQRIFGAIDKLTEKAPSLRRVVVQAPGLVAGAQASARQIAKFSTSVSASPQLLHDAGNMAVESFKGIEPEAATFMPIHDSLVGETLHGKDAAKFAMESFEATIPDVAARDRIFDVLDNPPKYLIGPNQTRSRVPAREAEEMARFPSKKGGAADDWDQSFEDEAREVVKRMAPGANLEIKERTSSGAQGLYQFFGYGKKDNLLTVALKTDDFPAMTAKHEVIHHLRHMGLFKESEWKLLAERSAKEWIDEFDIKARYSHLSKSGQIEEGIAEGFGHWMKFGKGDDLGIFSRIKEFFQGIKRALLKSGYTTTEDIFKAIHSGKIGRRKTFTGPPKLFVTKNLVTEAAPSFKTQVRRALQEEAERRPKLKSIAQVKQAGKFGETGLFGTWRPGYENYLSDHEFAAAQALEANLKKALQVMIDEGVMEDGIAQYAPRMVKKFLTPDGAAILQSRLPGAGTISKNMMHRNVLFLDELKAMEAEGLIEREKDPAKILGYYFQGNAKALANRRYIQRLSHANWVVEDATGTVQSAHPVFIPAGKGRKPPSSDYVFDDTIRPIKNHMVKAADGSKSYPYKDGVWIHKDAAGRLRRLFAEGIPEADPGKFISRKGSTPGETMLRSMLLLNGIAKRSQVGMPALFHFNSLTSSAAVSMGWPFLKKVPELMARLAASPFILMARKVGLPIDMRTLGEELRAMQANYPAHDIVELAAKSGMQTGGILEAEIDTVQRLFKSAGDQAMRMAGGGKLGRAAKSVTDTLGEGLFTWDRFLWDSAHSGYKVWAFSELYHKGLAAYPHVKPDDIARSVASHVDNAFGGRLWEKLFVGKAGQQWMRALLLAPDWTLSNINIALDVFMNFFARGAGAMADLGLLPRGMRDAVRVKFNPRFIQSADIKAHFARRYALRVGFISWAMAQLANFAFSGRWMEDNPEGRRYDIALPFDKGGKQLYWSVGKQFKEPFDWIADPISTLNFKKSPIMTTAATVMFDEDIFGRRISAVGDGQLMKTAKDFGYAFGVQPLPLGVQRGIKEGMGALPLIEQAGFRVRPAPSGGGRASKLPNIFSGQMTQRLSTSFLPLPPGV